MQIELEQKNEADGLVPGCVRVALANATGAFDRLYDYLVPAGMEGLGTGMRVIVPFGRANRPTEAWVISIPDPAEVSREHRLKQLSERVDFTPVIDGELIRVAEWMRTRFFCTWHQAISTMLPSGAKLKAERLIRLAPGAMDAEKGRVQTGPVSERQSAPESVRQREAMVADDPAGRLLEQLMKCPEGLPESELIGEHPDFETLVREGIASGRLLREVSYAPRAGARTERCAVPMIDQETLDLMVASHAFRSQPQLLAMEALMEEAQLPVSDLYRLPGVNAATLKALEKKGLIRFVLTASERDPFKELSVRETQPMPLTEEQASAASRLGEALVAEKPGEALVLGVTGSGKTELYLHLISRVLAAGRTAIVLVPEISLTPQMAERFIGRFGPRVAIQHSRLSTGERLDQWSRIRSGERTVVIGARSAIFAPVRNLGLVIIDEEHEPAYRSETTPRYDARLVARARCGMAGALLVYGSATPSLETYRRAVEGDIAFVEMTRRVNNRPLPQVSIVDMKEELRAGNRSIFSERLSKRLRETVESGEQAILFLNRRGFASCLLCRDCGLVLKCPECDLPLTIHRSGRAICHYCGFLAPVPSECPNCGGARLKAFGAGTQRIEADLRHQTEGYRVIRMDLDTTSGKDGHRLLLDAFRAKEADVLVGTQMVAKGHDFPDVTLVGILAADAVLYNGDYRAAERTFQLVTQAAGRAGRADRPGQVVIQAYNPDEYVLKDAIEHDFKRFAERELALRRKLFYPPWCHVGMIRLQAQDEAATMEMAAQAHRILLAGIEAQASPGAFLASQPGRAPMALIGGRHRWRILVRHVSAVRLCRLLEAVRAKALQACAAAGVDLNVEVDPVSML